MELRHLSLFRSNPFRSSGKFVRYAALAVVTCALVLMFRTSSEFYAKENQLTSFRVEKDSLVVDSNANVAAGDPVQTSAADPPSSKKSTKSKKNSTDDENDRSFNIAVQPLIHQTVNILDKYMDMEDTNYQAIRSMFLLWNPESSKWAAQVSGRYRDLVERRTPAPKDWFEEPDRDAVVDRSVVVEQCGCSRKIRAHTMITYEGEDYGGNKSVSACSFHSFARGAKQKVCVNHFKYSSFHLLTKRVFRYNSYNNNKVILRFTIAYYTSYIIHHTVPACEVMKN